MVLPVPPDGSGGRPWGSTAWGSPRCSSGVREGVSRVDARHESAGVAWSASGGARPWRSGARRPRDMASGDGAGGGRWTKLGGCRAAVAVDVRAARVRRRSEDEENWRTTTRRARRSTGRVRVRAGGSARTSGKRLAAGSRRFRVQRAKFANPAGARGKRARRSSVARSSRACCAAPATRAEEETRGTRNAEPRRGPLIAFGG